MDQKTTKQQSYLNKYSRISPNSQDWLGIEYNLQIALGSSTAVCRNIWSIANANMSLNFEKRNKGLLILDSWLPTNSLNEKNTPEKVCQKGFDFPEGGLLFPTGHLKLNQENYHGKNKVYEFFLVHVAVGRPYILSVKNGKSIQEKSKLPQGFDSIYLLYDDEEEESQVFKHDYVVFDNSQVLPMYVVQFEFDPKKEEDMSAPICDLCQENQASVYCKAEDANLCYFCDEEHHAKTGKLLSKHQRVPINERPKQFGKCPQHPEYILEFYCPIDKEPLCVYCKINGSHAAGEKVGHTLVKISEIYSKALMESKEKDPILEKRKSQLNDRLNNIDARMKEININATEVEENIYMILQEALRMLHEETQKKLSFLIADQVEIKREYEQIQWIQQFLRYQMDILSPADYLNAWSRYSVLRNEIISVPLPVETDVQPDMRVEGRITVLADTKVKSAQDESFGQVENTGLEDMSMIGTGSKFKANIFKKVGPKDTTPGSLLKGYSNLKNPMPMSANKLITTPVNEIFSKSLRTRADNDSLGLISEDTFKQFPQFSKMQISQQTPNEWDVPQKAHEIQSMAISLKAEAKKKLSAMRNTRTWGFQNEKENFIKELFKDSRILENDEGEILYLNLPFPVDQMPNVREISYRSDPTSDGPDMLELFKSHNNPNLILFKKGNQKFGGYASHPWIHQSSTYFGDNTCFLFSLTKDIKLIPKSTGEVKYLWQWGNRFSFGETDLVIEENFHECQSEIEIDYTTKIKIPRDETKTFLAGVERFDPDLIEIYTIEVQNQEY